MSRGDHKKTRIGFLTVFIIFEIFLALILAGILGWYGTRNSSPGSVMKTYCEAVAKKDWSTVYDVLNVPKNSSLTKQLFVDARRKNNRQGIFSSVTWEETVDWDPEIQEYEKWYGTEPSMKAYDATFYRTDGKDPVQWRVTLVKSRKKFFLFDEWKVSPQRYIIQSTGFTIPKGAAITLNGTKVMTDEWAEGNWQSFGIEFLFAGDYQLQVSMDGMQTYKDNLKLDKSGQCFTIQLLPTSDGQAELLEKAERDIQEILQAALTDKSFGTISDLFSTEVLKNGDIQNQYNELRKRGSIGGEGISWLRIDQISGNLYAREAAYATDEENDMIVNLTGHAYERYITSDGSSSGLMDNEKDFEISMQAQYARTNGQWKLIVFPVTADML